MGLATRGRKPGASPARIDTIAPFAKYPNVAVKLSAVRDFRRSLSVPGHDAASARLIEAFGPQRHSGAPITPTSAASIRTGCT